MQIAVICLLKEGIQMKKIRISMPLKEDVYNELKEMSEQSGTSMSAFAGQIVTQHIKAYKKLYETLSEPVKMAELLKAMNESNESD